MDGATPRAGSLRATPARIAASAALLVVAGAVLAWVLRGVDAAELRAAWETLDRGRMSWLLLGFLANHGLRVLRWHLLLGEAPFAESAVACLVGFLGVPLLPLRLGELVRPWIHARGGTPLGHALAALAVERALDLLGLSLLLLWVAVVPELPPFVVAGVDVVTIARRSAGLGAAVLVVGLPLLAALGPRVAGWPVVGGLAGSVGAGLRQLAATPARAVPAVLLTLGTWGSFFAYVTAALACFPGLPGGPMVGTVTAAAIIAGTTALPTPGFFGSYEASMVAALGLYGAGEGTASAAALFLHVAYLLFVAVAALPAAALLPSLARR